jgi:hypothetical protein
MHIAIYNGPSVIRDPVTRIHGYLDNYEPTVAQKFPLNVQYFHFKEF